MICVGDLECAAFHWLMAYVQIDGALDLEHPRRAIAEAKAPPSVADDLSARGRRTPNQSDLTFN